MPPVLTGAAACYRTYATADGRWLTVAALEPKFFARLCELPASRSSPGAQYEPRLPELEARLAERPLAEWLELFDGEDVCAGPVATLEEAAAEFRAEPPPGRRAAVGEHTEAGGGSWALDLDGSDARWPDRPAVPGVPEPLVGEGGSQQEQPEHDQRGDAVDRRERGEVVREHLRDREQQQAEAPEAMAPLPEHEPRDQAREPARGPEDAQEQLAVLARVERRHDRDRAEVENRGRRNARQKRLRPLVGRRADEANRGGRDETDRDRRRSRSFEP